MFRAANKITKTLTSLPKPFKKEQSHENSNKSKPTFKESLRAVFFGKKTLTFLATYLVAVLLVGGFYYAWIYRLSLNEPLFDINYDISATPDVFLNNALTCDDSAIFNNCGSTLLMFLLIPLASELTLLVFTFSMKKISRGSVLFLFFIASQLIIAGVFLYYLYLPKMVVNSLSKKASEEIKNAVEILYNKEKLNELLATPVDCVACIANEIEKSKGLPRIIDANPSEITIMKILGIDLENKNSFYRAIVVPYLLFNKGANVDLDSELSKPHFEMVLFPDLTLVAGFTTKQTVQLFAPMLSKKLLQQKLPNYAVNERVIEFNVLDQKDYVAYQKIEEEKGKKEMLDAINQVKSDIAYLDKIINDNQSIIDNYEDNIKRNEDDYDYYVKDLQKTYDEVCKTNDYPECKALKNLINDNKTVIEKERNDIEVNRKNAEIYNNEARASRREYVSILDSLQRTYDKMLKEPITAEYQDGISYLSQDKTFIKFYDGANNKTLNAYLFTSLHEYLHQVSYAGGTAELPLCLEEGITDQATALLLKEVIPNSENYISYMFEAGVVNIMLDTVPYDELMSVYFDKSDAKLNSLFEKYYDASLYNDFVNKCNYLYYTDVNDLEAKEQRYKDILDILLTSVESKLSPNMGQ